MSRKRNRMQPIVQDAEFEEVQDTSQMPEGEGLNLDDVAYMVAVGRKKNGKPFFVNVNVSDFFTIDGLVQFANAKTKRMYNEFFDNEDKEVKGE